MSFPILYDSNIAVLSKLSEILEYEKKIKEFDEDNNEVKLNQLNHKSVLIHDLKNICDQAMEDWKKFEFPRFSARNRDNRVMDKERKYFFLHGVKSYANEICEIVDGIITFDGYTNFGNYLELRDLVNSTYGIDSLTYLKKLVILSRHVITSIPRFEETKLIVPSISANTRTMFG